MSLKIIGVLPYNSNEGTSFKVSDLNPDLKKGDEVKITSEKYNGTYVVYAVTPTASYTMVWLPVPYTGIVKDGTIDKISTAPVVNYNYPKGTVPILDVQKLTSSLTSPANGKIAIEIPFNSLSVKKGYKVRIDSPKYGGVYVVDEVSNMSARQVTILHFYTLQYDGNSTGTISEIALDKMAETPLTTSNAAGTAVSGEAPVLPANTAEISNAGQLHSGIEAIEGKTFFYIDPRNTSFKKGDRAKITTPLYNGTYMVSGVTDITTNSQRLDFYDIVYKGTTQGKIEKLDSSATLTVQPVDVSKPSTAAPATPVPDSTEAIGNIKSISEISSSIPERHGKIAIYLTPGMKLTVGEKINLDAYLYKGEYVLDSVNSDSTLVHIYSLAYKGNCTGKIYKIFPQSTANKGVIKGISILSSTNPDTNGKLTIYLTPGMTLKKGDTVKITTSLYNGSYPVDYVNTDCTSVHIHSIAYKGNSLGTLEKIASVQTPTTQTPTTQTQTTQTPTTQTTDAELAKFKLDFMNYVNNNTKVKQIRKVVSDYPSKTAATSAGLNLTIWEACYSIESIINEILQILK